jgi:hypothetical protein
LVAELTQRRQSNTNTNDDDDDETTTFSLIEKALLVNPDPTFLWNHRREWILARSKQEDDSIVLQRELTLTQASLQRNPKAYGAWFHRKWILQHTDNLDDYQEQIELTEANYRKTTLKERKAASVYDYGQ